MLGTTLTVSQDGTIANGNWSARELCSVLNLRGYVAGFLPSGRLTISEPGLDGYSLFGLVQVLHTIATGNWIGPGGYVLGNPSLQGLSRPAGFRERLAAAAV